MNLRAVFKRQMFRIHHLAAQHEARVCNALSCSWQMLDVIFENRPIQRFWFLETVARMPYFS